MRITTLINIVAIAAVSAALFACSNGNSGNVAPVDNSGKHAANWVQQHGAAAQASMSACTECHGSDLSGGIANVSCTTSSINGFKCHATSPAVTSGCASCHGGAPNGPDGTAFPNNQGAHDSHTAVPNVTCSACHNGLGSGTAHHGDGTQVVNLSPDFQAETVVTDFKFHPVNPAQQTDGGTCSGVSCHGGQVTPEWLTKKWSDGTLFNLATDCKKCHKSQLTAPPQFNDYFSGSSALFPGVNLHQFHIDTVGLSCTFCHNVNKLDNQTHFGGTGAATPGITIGGGPTLITVYDISTSTCTANCHSSVPTKWK
jgi:predicted CxxxxCH...CXXCH cytochrome family protein